MDIKVYDVVRIVDTFFSSKEAEKYTDHIKNILRINNWKVNVVNYLTDIAILHFNLDTGPFQIPLKYLEKLKVRETLTLDKDEFIRIVEMAYAEGRQRFWKAGDSTEVIADYKNSYTYKEFQNLCEKLKINYERKDY